jgi:hypothetical protein
MRVNFFLVLLFFLAAPGAALFAAPQNTPDATKDELAGAVKTVEQRKFYYQNVNGQLIEGERLYHLKKTYNRAGFVTEWINFENGKIESRINYTLDDQGNILKTTKVKEGAPIERTVFHYDKVGREVGYSLVGGDGDRPPKFVKTYDEAGRLTEEKSFLANGTLTSRRIFQYNPAGELIEVDEFSDGKPESRVSYTYDQTGKLIKQTEEYLPGSFRYISQVTKVEINFDEQGREIRRYNYQEDRLVYAFLKSYDEKGRIKESITIKVKEYKVVEMPPYSNPPGKKVYVYNQAGQLSELLAYSAPDRLRGKTVYVYDERGNQIESIQYQAEYGLSAPGEPVFIQTYRDVYKYEYDALGNWTKIVNFYAAGKEELRQNGGQIRLITYY